jgi:hypothetical protein
MKPQVYFDNKNSEIINKSVMVNLQIPRATNNGGRDMDKLRLHVFDFLALAPDETDTYTDTTWVRSWKAVYNHLTDAIRDVKDIGDYRLDAKRRELSSIASALLPARRAVYWLD